MVMQKKDKWSGWREEKKEIISEAVKWVNSPTESMPESEYYTLLIDDYILFNAIGYRFFAMEDLRDFFDEGCETKRSLKRLLIKRGVNKDVFTSKTSLFHRFLVFFGRSSHPDLA